LLSSSLQAFGFQWSLALAPLVLGAVDRPASAPIEVVPPPALRVLPPLGEGDADRDGLLDAEEAELARTYAPLVILDRQDENRPASVEWLLKNGGSVERDGFTVAETARAGAQGAADRATYVHVFPRSDGGISLQYWFFYPYNDGPFFFDHDSDWEHMTVRLDASRKPVGAYLARHTEDNPGRWFAWSDLRHEAEHPVVLSATGSHATYANDADVGTFDRASACADVGGCADPIWRTWTSELVNLGERKQPLTRDAAFAYPGRWGRTHAMPGTSAPFGPLHHRGFCVDGLASCDAGAG
jgi:hypothetical protein